MILKKGEFPYPKQDYVFEYPELYAANLEYGIDYDLSATRIELEDGTHTVLCLHVPISRDSNNR